MKALSTQVQNQKQKEGSYTHEEIIDEFSIFYMAGTDTTSHLLTMMVYYSVLNPTVMEKLRQEISDKVKDNKNLNYEILK